MNSWQFASLREVKEELLRMKDRADIRTAQWSLYEMLVHCAQTIEYSMSGYPKMKPKLVRQTVGRLVIRKFLRQGRMKHNLTAHVPGAEAVAAQGTPEEGIERLLQAIAAFEAHKGPFAPHLIFGELSKEEYDRYFAMHVADHFSEVQIS